MAYTRITAIWTGATGLPGYTRLKFQGDLDSAAALACANRVRTFFDSIKAFLPSAISINFAEAAQVYDLDQTLTAEVGFTPPALVLGGGAGSFSSPTGMVVNWLTSLIFQGHKVRGRSFLVPLAGTAYQSDGSLATATITAVQGAATALIAGTPSLVVASGGNGSFAVSPVNAMSVPDRAAVLRSRRD